MSLRFSGSAVTGRAPLQEKCVILIDKISLRIHRERSVEDLRTVDEVTDPDRLKGPIRAN